MSGWGWRGEVGGRNGKETIAKFARETRRVFEGAGGRGVDGDGWEK